MIATPLSYAERAQHCQNELGKQLLSLMDLKQTNLALSADVTTAAELLALAQQVGPEICVLKTHIDIISDFTPELTYRLRTLADKYSFLLFEDRKFADIGNTVKHQYEGGIYRIADWADMVNAHGLPGPGIVQGLAEGAQGKQRGLLLLAEMSSAGNWMDQAYRQRTLLMAESFPEFVMGFITQRALTDAPQWINMTPGVKLESGTDKLGQQYVAPASAILEQGTDVLIVGRGIITAQDPLAEAKRYREAGWENYQKRVNLINK